MLYGFPLGCVVITPSVLNAVNHQDISLALAQHTVRRNPEVFIVVPNGSFALKRARLRVTSCRDRHNVGFCITTDQERMSTIVTLGSYE